MCHLVIVFLIPADLNQIVAETIPALRKLQVEGLVRYVGISGYPLDALWIHFLFMI